MMMDLPLVKTYGQSHLKSGTESASGPTKWFWFNKVLKKVFKDYVSINQKI